MLEFDSYAALAILVYLILNSFTPSSTLLYSPFMSDDAPSDGADDSFWTRGGNPSSSSSFDTVLGSVESNEVSTVLNSGEGFQRLAG
jgi:hypothetical protein